MAPHTAPADNEARSDVSSNDRRFSASRDEERDIGMPVEGDLSEVSTLAGDEDNSYGSAVKLEDTYPDRPDDPVRTTLAVPTNASQTGRPEGLARNDSRVMEVKKETKKWYSYPRHGYITTTKFFYEEIDEHWSAALIIICFFVSGIIDSVSYMTYGVFTSLQTGNTVLLALQLSDQPELRNRITYIKSATSVASYCVGGLFFNLLHRASTNLSNTKPPLKRWTLLTTFVVQSALQLIVASLAQSGWISTRTNRVGSFSPGSFRNPDAHVNYLDLIPIALLAFEAAGQVCLSRVLIVNELPTIVISTLYHDFIADALCWRQLWRTRESFKSFTTGQKRQIRRFLSIIALFSGALIGGFVYASPGGLAAALWIASGMKIVVSVAWCLWKKKKVTETVVTVQPA